MADEAAPVRIEMSADFQGVTIWAGDGAPCTVDDRHTAADVRDWITAPLQRAAAVARLRAIADMLDDNNPAHLMTDEAVRP